MTDEEVLALEKVLVKNNKKVTHVCFSLGTYGVGNTNTSPYSGRDDFYPIESYDNAPIFTRRGGFRISAIVDDVMYIVVEGKNKVIRLQEGKFVSEVREIAYDTREEYAIGIVSKPKN